MSKSRAYRGLVTLLLAAFFLIPAATFAQTDTGIQQIISDLSDSVQSAKAETRQLRRDISGGMLIIDTTAVQYAQAHPDSLYRHSILKPANQHGPYAATAWLRCILTLLLLAGMWVYGYQKFTTSSLCRDICFNADGTQKPYDKCPYSYSRVQLFWWTMIILTCYLYSYAITGVLMPVNETIGILLGFSVTVYAGGKVIDNRQIMINPANTRSQDTQNGSQGLLTDILSDDIGTSVYRFQTVIFNVIFGLGFFFFFLNGMQGHIYPFADFSAWQYGLLGISSAAYLGLKAAENNPDVTPGSAVAASNNNNNAVVNNSSSYSVPVTAYNQPTGNYASPASPSTPPINSYIPPAAPDTTATVDTTNNTDNSGITQS